MDPWQGAPDLRQSHWPPSPPQARRNHSIASTQRRNPGELAHQNRSNEALIKPWQSSASVPSIWGDMPWPSDAQEVTEYPATEEAWNLSRKYSQHSDYDPTTLARLRTPPPDLTRPHAHVQRLWSLDTPRHSAPQTFLEATIAKLSAEAVAGSSIPAKGAPDEMRALARPAQATPTSKKALGVDDSVIPTRRWPSFSVERREPSARTGSLGSYDLAQASNVSMRRSRLPTPLKESDADPSGLFRHLSLQESLASPPSPRSQSTGWNSANTEGVAPETQHALEVAPEETTKPITPTSASLARDSSRPAVYMAPTSSPMGPPLWTPPAYSLPYAQPSLVPPLPLPQRAFVIKSFPEVDVQRSIDHGVWTSTDKGNQRLDRAWKHSHARGPIYLFFSVNGSGRFCGIAQMMSGLDYNQSSNIWADGTRWKGLFHVRWLLIKDVPNAQLRHIYLPNTADLRPVTKSRDTQELLPEAAVAVLHIFCTYTGGYSSLLSRDTSSTSR